jgi:hypothetical protein
MTPIPFEKAKEIILRAFPVLPLNERYAFIRDLVQTFRNELAPGIKAQLIESLKLAIGLEE